MVCDLANGKRGVSPRMAVMLSRAFGVSPEFWMGLQADHDLSTLMQSSAGKRVQDIPPMVQPRKAV